MRIPGLFSVNGSGVTFGRWLTDTGRTGTTVENITAWLAS